MKKETAKKPAKAVKPVKNVEAKKAEKKPVKKAEKKAVKKAPVKAEKKPSDDEIAFGKFVAKKPELENFVKRNGKAKALEFYLAGIARGKSLKK